MRKNREEKVPKWVLQSTVLGVEVLNIQGKGMNCVEERSVGEGGCKKDEESKEEECTEANAVNV